MSFIAQAVYGFELGKLDLRCSLIPGDSRADFHADMYSGYEPGDVPDLLDYWQVPEHV